MNEIAIRQDARPADGPSLSARLRRSCGTLSEFELDDPNSRLPYLRADEARAALSVIDPECAPADVADLMAELGRVSAVTISSKGDAETMLASTRILAVAMLEFPAGAAMGAIRDWTRGEQGKWWPTEKELRDAAQARAATLLRIRDHLRRDARRGAAKGPRSHLPSGKTEAFVNEVRALRGDDFAFSWLGHVTCQFQDDVIWTSDIGIERLDQTCSGLIRKYGIEVVADDQSRQHFRDQTEAYAKRGKP